MKRKKILSKNNKVRLSVVVVTKNEEEMIKGCLESVIWADEVIVIDAESTDKSKKIAKKFTPKVFTKKWAGFATQKNYGIKKASGDWILILDADERVSRELKKEIKEVISNPGPYSAFKILFISYFLGKRMKHGGWQNEYHLRLFRKNGAKYTQQQFHEILRFRGQSKVINKPIYHFSHRSISENLLKTKQYATVQSSFHFIKKAPPVTRLKLLKRIISHFLRRYIVAKGYKDGMEGLIEALYQSFSQIFIIQAMLWERQRGKTSKQLYDQLDKKLKKNDWSLS